MTYNKKKLGVYKDKYKRLLKVYKKCYRNVEKNEQS